MPLSKKVQELVDAVSSHRQSLLDSVSGLSEAQLDYKPEGSRWSIADILHHLALTDEANAKLISRMLKQAQALSLPLDPKPHESALNSLDGYADALRNTKAQAPEFVEPQSHLPVEESLARLKASRKKLLESVEHLSQYDLSQLSYPHPLLGNLNLYQWILISGGHERRHTGQIGRIKAEAGFPKN
ncbi:MAG: DinB family protein [Blastocatellia bacterium]